MVARSAAGRAPSRRKPSSSSGSATSAARWAGRSCMTRCAAVAGRGLFRGWGPDDLAEHGIGFTLVRDARPGGDGDRDRDRGSRPGEGAGRRRRPPAG